MITRPRRRGWYWFLPNEQCVTRAGHLMLDVPILLHVGGGKCAKGMTRQRLVVRFPTGKVYVDEMLGDWQSVKAPKPMRLIAMQRAIENAQSMRNESQDPTR